MTFVIAFEGKKSSRISVPIPTWKSSAGNTLPYPTLKDEMLKVKEEERQAMKEEEDMDEEEEKEQDELSVFLAFEKTAG